MKTNKIFAIGVVMVLSMALVGCGSISDTGNYDNTSEYVAETSTECMAAENETATDETTAIETTVAETETVAETKAAKKTETKPAETKAAEKKETKPAETKAAEKKGTKSAEKKETKSAETKPAKKEQNKEQPTTAYDPDGPNGFCTQKDAPRVAAEFIKVLNEYRAEEGQPPLVQGSPQMQAFADLRAKQISTNFGHDYDDTREAVRALNYGEFWESYGIVQPYQSSTEACGWPNMNGGSKFLAKYVVDCFRESRPHWSYLGNGSGNYSDLKYIAVGIYFRSGHNPFFAVWLDSEWHTEPIYFE